MPSAVASTSAVGAVYRNANSQSAARTASAGGLPALGAPLGSGLLLPDLPHSDFSEQHRHRFSLPAIVASGVAQLHVKSTGVATVGSHSDRRGVPAQPGFEPGTSRSLGDTSAWVSAITCGTVHLRSSTARSLTAHRWGWTSSLSGVSSQDEPSRGSVRHAQVQR